MACINLLFYQVNEAVHPGTSSSTDTGEAEHVSVHVLMLVAPGVLVAYSKAGIGYNSGY